MEVANIPGIPEKQPRIQPQRLHNRRKPNLKGGSSIYYIFRIYDLKLLRIIQFASNYLGGTPMSTNPVYPTMDSLPLVLRIEDLTTILGVGRNTAYALVRSGQIKSIRIGRQLRITRD